MTSRKALDSPDAYVVAWIAALPIERASAEAMLDEEHAVPTGFTRNQNDGNVYTWGCIGEHNIVIASLPAGVYGTTSAATTASSLLASLPSIRIGLLVGIGGGIARPDEDHDIRLGDVVVSQPDGATGGVCQYDLIKAKPGDIRELKGFLGRPPTVLLHALASIQAEHERKDSKIPFFLQEMLNKNPKMGRKSKKNPGYCHQGFDNDRFFKAPSIHVPGPDCRGCDAADEAHRDPRDTTDPDIHYGIIASGNTLVKDAAARDQILTDVGEDCICFEMEAAGLMNHFPCLVIRGICDYADSHKNDQWQRYASATAAAYAKELLAYVPAAEVQETKKALEVLRSEYGLTKTVQQQIDDVQRTTTETKAATDTVKSCLRADQIKSWLRPPDPSTNANHARTLRHEGTGTWLLRHSVFQSWLSGSCRHLWLHGLAGCGKTVLSATVLDHLNKEFSLLVLSFFFDFGNRKKQTLYGMLQSLAFQLYQSGPDSAGLLDASFQAHQDGRDQPTTSTLEEVVLKMLAINKKCYIVLDALDESTARSEVLQWMENVVSRPELGDVQLICTSRPEFELSRRIPRFFGNKNCLPLDKQAVNADIRSWVTAQLSQRPDFLEKPLSHDLLEQIRREVGDGADGMFRWAFCQLDTLARCRHEAAMETALASLPMSLGETYRRMIDNIPRELAKDAIRLLQFLVHSESPIELTEAKEIIATQIESESPRFDIKRRLFCETDILDYCPGLVTVVDAADKELHLAHFSVKEYLVGEHQFNITAANISITKTYLTYLTDINSSHREVQIQRDFPMAMRAANFWTRCAMLAQDSEAIVRATTRFLKEEATFQRWARLCEPWKDHPSPPKGFGLYYACLFGLPATARDLIGNGASVSMQGGQLGNALQAASYGGHRDVIQLLLDKGADINEKGGKYGNALQAALSKGYGDIAQLLLDKGADINAQGGIHGNALQAASYRGYPDIIQLLEKGANINARGGVNKTALQAASYRGHLEIVQLLLDRGADINAQGDGGYHSNALQAASCTGHKEIVQLLLDKGADVNTQGGYYGDALQAASIAGRLEIVQLLLNKGADVNAQGGVYGNALQAASVDGHQEVVQLLLDKGADVNAQGGQFGNALKAAADRGRQAILQLLVNKGAEAI